MTKLTLLLCGVWLFAASGVAADVETCWTARERQSREASAVNDFVRARELMRSALECMNDTTPAVERAHVLEQFARMLADRAEAERCLREALALRELALGTDDPSLGDTLWYLSDTLSVERDAEALQLLERALQIRERSLGKSDARTADSMYRLGMAYIGAGRLAQGEALCRQAIAVLESFPLEPGSPLPGYVFGLGDVLCRRNRCAEGRVLQDKGVELGGEVDRLEKAAAAPAPVDPH